MLIYGWGRKLKPVAPIVKFDECPNCGMPSVWYLAVLKKDINVFFIPVARWNSAFYLLCSACQGSIEVDKVKGKAIMERVQAGVLGDFDVLGYLFPARQQSLGAGR